MPPGLTFCLPSVTTISPAAKPDTAAKSPMACSTLMGFTNARLLASMTNTLAPVSDSTMALCATVATASSVATRRLISTNWPGHSCCLLLASVALSVSMPVAGLMRLSIKVSLPRCSDVSTPGLLLAKRTPTACPVPAPTTALSADSGSENFTEIGSNCVSVPSGVADEPALTNAPGLTSMAPMRPANGARTW